MVFPNLPLRLLTSFVFSRVRPTHMNHEPPQPRAYIGHGARHSFISANSQSPHPHRCLVCCQSQVKSKITSKITRKPNTQNRAQPMCLSGQPALKVRLAASSKRDGNEWAWVVLPRHVTARKVCAQQTPQGLRSNASSKCQMACAQGGCSWRALARASAYAPCTEEANSAP